MLQKTIISRFYDGLTNAECERKMYIAEGCAKKHVRNGIAIIAKNSVPLSTP
jgi:hypothetical protein